MGLCWKFELVELNQNMRQKDDKRFAENVLKSCVIQNK